MSEEPIRPLVPRPKGMQQGLLPPAYPTTPVLLSPTTPRSILKNSETPAAPKSESSASSASTASSPSKSKRQKVAEHGQEVDIPKLTKARKVKEGAFFAFVLLPLSCWYTRGGKRLRELDDFDDEPFRPRPSQQLQRTDSMSIGPGQQLQRRSSVSMAPSLQRRSSISVSVPMQSPGPGRWR
ncbi:hypothetical protein BDZ45DRAFT_678677 [Acephala macrosclerotiorum]|nr:hypothetical protein BDZ45DRAFT_678677 [Acephala macrosclerotiorum]